MEHYKLIAFAHNGRSLIVGASMQWRITTMGSNRENPGAPNPNGPNGGMGQMGAWAKWGHGPNGGLQA